jgi:hypothetical protein
VLLYFVVTGEYPVIGQSVLELTLAHRRRQRRLLADRRPDLPEGFVRAVERALAPDPSDRPASAGAMMQDLTTGLPGSIAWAGHVPSGMPIDPTTPGGTPPHALLSSAPATPAAISPARAWIMVVLGGTAGIGGIGLLTTAAFNQSLERDGSFSTDGVLDPWVFGARSLVYPLLLAGVVVLIARLAVTMWQALLRVVPPLRRVIHRGARSLAWTAPHLGVGSAVTLSQWLVFLQFVALAVMGFQYHEFVEAVTLPGTTTAARVALLAPTSTVPLYYRTWMTLILVGTIAAWLSLLSRPGARAAIHRSTLMAGVAGGVLALLMLVVPYRLLYHNEMPRTSLAGARCYETGSRAGQVLLYCPDSLPPRVRLVDPAMLTRPATTVRESIFSQAPGDPP